MLPAGHAPYVIAVAQEVGYVLCEVAKNPRHATIVRRDEGASEMGKNVRHLRIAAGLTQPRWALRSFCRRWHPLEVGNILWRLVPRSPSLGVDDGLRRKPIVLVETAHRDAYHTGPR